MDLSKLAPPRKGSGMEPRSYNRQSGEQAPNPFVVNGWLKASYDEDQDYEVTTDGKFEEVPAKKGANKGQPVERLTGDAAEVTRLIRQAADLLGLGVSIQYADAVYASGKNKGEVVPGKVVIKYKAKQRKQRKTTEPPAPPVDPKDGANN